MCLVTGDTSSTSLRIWALILVSERYARGGSPLSLHQGLYRDTYAMYWYLKTLAVTFSIHASPVSRILGYRFKGITID
jgi:hypothetical protein